MDAWAFAAEPAYNKLCKQLGVSSLKGFGAEGQALAVSAAGAILCYLEMTQHSALGHIRTLSRLDEGAGIEPLSHVSCIGRQALYH